ncbi:glyoxylate/hydroxypyruvate reductase A [Chromatiaceae bacterium AAb-1]|nr:glyoxylate/hydroxypyruvate reductase A [Chromatiaceae bacterium AAb-1]
MSIALIIPDRKLDDLQQRLQQALPDVLIEIWPDITAPQQVEFAVVWKHAHGCLSAFPELKAIQSFGAGVDNILADPHLPDVPLSRIVDPELAAAMVAYLDGVVSYYKLRLDLFRQQQQQQLWKPRANRKIKHITVLGLGELGAAVAQHFQQAGYQVSGWARSARTLPGITCYHQQEQFAAAVADADVVICLLPLTVETENLLNDEAFSAFKTGGILINVARGAIVDDQALLRALAAGKLEAACLDVFRQEPLAAEHLFWQHPAILITPHISAVTNVATVVAQIAENYSLSIKGLPLLHRVNYQRGY